MARIPQLKRNVEGETFARIVCMYGCTNEEICQHNIKEIKVEENDNGSMTSSDHDVQDSIDDVYSMVS